MLRDSRICSIDYINSLLDHGLLLGLADDDHTQYLLANGSRDLTGNWTIATKNIILTAGTLRAEALKSDTSVWLLDMGNNTFLKIRALDSAYNANKFLDIDLSNNNRTLTISGNPTIADWFDQDVKKLSNVNFTSVTLGGSTGVKLSAVSGELALAGIGGTFNENLLLDFESVENTIGFSSSSGATKLDFGSLALDAGVTTITSTTTPQLTIKYDGDNSTSIQTTSGGDMYLNGGTDFRFIGNDGAGAGILLYDGVSLVARFSHSGTGGSFAFQNDFGNFTIRNTANTDILLYTNNILRMVIRNAGSVGFGGENNPETLTEWTSATPYLTLHNSTHEDTDGGRESRLNFKGEKDTSGDESTLARIEVSHDGSDADEKGKIVISTNDGDDANTPTDQLMVQSTGDWVINKTSGIGIKVDLSAPTFGWRDLLGDQFAKNTGDTKPALVAYNDTVFAWRFSDGDEAYLTYHIPHDYVAGTDIHLHVHWSQNAAGATGGTIDFKYFAIYAKGHNQDEAAGSFTSPDPITATFSSININDGKSGLNRYQQHLTEVVISAATATGALFDRDDLEPDGVIELTLEMDSDNLTGTASSPFIHYVDIHYQSTNIGTKDKVPDFYT